MAELQGEFDKRDVQVLTISTDEPEMIRKRRGVHRLQARMLSDRNLAVTDTFGLRNQLIHSGPLDVEALPVPTTLLVSSDGEVLWIDQAENYQRRSGPEVVLAALQTHLDAP
ncbi:MAG TPA: redoxin domain-containing protein [Gammaproteobacteria bacterium]|nr:redoxin domain-containing protein [Gammaproteobacteria bacterium]